MPTYPHLRGLNKQEVRLTLDRVARKGAQRMLLRALEQEVEEFFGRARYEHRAGRRRGYRNGAGKPRKIAVGCGTLEIRAPRVRDTDEPFRSQLVPRYQRSSEGRSSDGVAHLLRLPAVALEEFAHVQPDRVGLRPGPVADPGDAADADGSHGTILGLPTGTMSGAPVAANRRSPRGG